MFDYKSLYENYDQLLPSKDNGGSLVIAIYEKIESKELPEYFTISDIKNLLPDIARENNSSTIYQAERILGILLNYYLKGVPNEPGKYYLTDYAKSIVMLMINKLQNPYKNLPLKQVFERIFYIRFNEIGSIADLETRFGSDFIDTPKRLINGHLEALDDELRTAYERLAKILQTTDHLSATQLVKNFTAEFEKFGQRAEDISNAIASKENFMRALENQVQLFYDTITNYVSDTAENKEQFIQLKSNWEKAMNIYQDLESYFLMVNLKITNIRKQIWYASDKLSELHEHFTSRAHLRLQIKRMFQVALENATYTDDGPELPAVFPLKNLVFEETRLIFPEYIEYKLDEPNYVVKTEADPEYEAQERKDIDTDVRRKEIINKWVNNVKVWLEEGKKIQTSWLIDHVIASGYDSALACQVAIELTLDIAENKNYNVQVLQEKAALEHDNMLLWKVNIKNSSTHF